MPAPARTRTRKPAAVRDSVARAADNGTRHHPVLDPIITMNAGGIIQSASDSVEQVFGWTPTELFGRNVKVLIPEPRRSSLDRYLDRYRHADSAKALKRMRRFEGVRKDGTVIPIELSMSRADLPAHAAPYFIGIVRDVSREIDVGAGTKGEHTRLQHLITAQTRALATANLRLQLTDRLASIGTLAAGLGHDMNNVLLPVRARLDALEHAGITSAARGHVTAMRRSIAYLQHLSDGLHFLALDPDGPGLASDGEGATNLAKWWGQVGTLLRKAIPRHVTLRASFPAGLPAVRIAPHWLTQAMLNLIVNAGESIPEGRRRAIVRIWANAADDGRTVRLGVTDSGRGMAPAIQRRAFDLFFTTKPRSMGTGLGLPLARKVAVRAGGEIELKSEPGKGTTVVLSLPATIRDTAAPGAGGRSAKISVRDHRTAALISQVVLKSGLTLAPGNGGGPGNSDVWVTEPTPKALAAAQAWRNRHAARAVVLLGAPRRSAQHGWAALGATIIEPVDDFEAIRHALGVATGGGAT
ncbi:MAG: ATP-binding protein [Phycisphaerales bacterium]